jgi:hypothetical protein
MLAEIYGWFTEGFDTRDLKDAKTLLDELNEQPTASVSASRTPWSCVEGADADASLDELSAGA